MKVATPDSEHSHRYLAEFLDPLTSVLGRSERRVGALRYLQGLLLPGERKSIEPMAQRLGVDSQGLQQFVADSPWDDAALWGEIRCKVIPTLGRLEAWIVDETGWLKQGKDSAGVSHQYCGAVGKQANCQVCVEIAVSDGEIAAPAAGKLYLPEKWCLDSGRLRKAGVPDSIAFKTKPQIAIELLGQMISDCVARAPVLAAAAYLAEFIGGRPQPAACLRLSRSRWHIEQYFQRGKSDLGLDHYEGRSWRGFHHRLVLCALACLSVLSLKQREKKTSGPTWEAVLRLIQPFLLRSTGRRPFCGTIFGLKIEDST
ncbi:MAG: transposase [Terrimicrobiaceae bacterium]|nr:transposase [Terrimicrobiaceae bacterium]